MRLLAFSCLSIAWFFGNEFVYFNRTVSTASRHSNVTPYFTYQKKKKKSKIVGITIVKLVLSFLFQLLVTLSSSMPNGNENILNWYLCSEGNLIMESLWVYGSQSSAALHFVLRSSFRHLNLYLTGNHVILLNVYFLYLI